MTAVATSGVLDGSTGTLTAAGLAAFPELKGPVPFDTGSYGYGATVDSGGAVHAVPDRARPDTSWRGCTSIRVVTRRRGWRSWR